MDDTLCFPSPFKQCRDLEWEDQLELCKSQGFVDQLAEVGPAPWIEDADCRRTWLGRPGMHNVVVTGRFDYHAEVTRNWLVDHGIRADLYCLGYDGWDKYLKDKVDKIMEFLGGFYIRKDTVKVFEDNEQVLQAVKVAFKERRITNYTFYLVKDGVLHEHE